MTNDGYFCLIKEFRKLTEVFFLYIYLIGVKIFSLKEKDRWQIWSVFCSFLFCRKEREMPHVFSFWSEERCLSCELTSLLQVFIPEMSDTKSRFKSCERPLLSKERMKGAKMYSRRNNEKNEMSLQKATLESKILKPQWTGRKVRLEVCIVARRQGQTCWANGILIVIYQ